LGHRGRERSFRPRPASRPLIQVDVHPSPEFVAEWLEPD